MGRLDMQVLDGATSLVTMTLNIFSLTLLYFITTEQHAFKNVNKCWNTNIYSYLETSGGQSSNPYLNVVHFFKHQSLLEICGSLRQLFSCIFV